MIKDFLKWWYTASNGEEYMTFLHCSQDDLHIVIITGLLCLLLMFIYGRILWYSKIQYDKYADSETKEYLKTMFNVFLVCSLTGYGYTLLSIFINPYKLRIVLLSMLAFWSWRFSLTVRSKNIISNIMKGQKFVQDKLVEIKGIELDVMQKFNKYNKPIPKMITVEELSSLEQDVWYNSNEEVRYKLVADGDKSLTFVTELMDGGVFGLHYHNCQETIYVHEGVLVCPEKGFEVSDGGRVVFEAYEKHRPYADGFVTLTVIFKK